MMDIDMDIDYDAGASIDVGAQPVQAILAQDNNTEMPAAYFEDLDAKPLEQWPDHLNLQGVSEFDPNDPLYYAMEHCLELRVKQTRWINDNSVNLQFYSAEDAAMALQALTDPGAGDPASIPTATGRKARPFSKKPEVILSVRQANEGDQKARGAANRSNFYKHNPDVRGERDRGRVRGEQPRRRQPMRNDYLDLDYDGEDSRPRTRTSASGDERMRDDSTFDRRRDRRNDNRNDNRLDNRLDSRIDNRPGNYNRNENRNGNRERMTEDVDSYRPGPKRKQEPHFGRLRGRSASPGSGDEGDGRYGFTEQGTSTRSRYRSRSRNRNNERRRREPSADKWTHDRAGFDQEPPARRSADVYEFDQPPSMSNHRRSDAFDETAHLRKGSLLSRMTKDDVPLAPKSRPLASRITRDDYDDDGDNYGRLKDDYSDVRAAEFEEPRHGLAGRVSREDDDNEGINIRGASQGGFSIRGMAGGY